MIITILIANTFILTVLIISFYVITKNIKYMNDSLKAQSKIKTLSVEVMEALAHTIDAKDTYTRGHSVRVAKYSRMIAEKMGMSETEQENVYYCGLLHDIGKIAVPNEIINGTEALSNDEYSVVMMHPSVGADILNEIKSLPEMSIGARYHHERYDGKGYPDGIAGEDIPLFARIIAVADSYDAMTSNRSYRSYLPQKEARDEIEKNKGSQFDPEIADIMLQIIDEDKEYAFHE
jgi:putative nucleotidyltransferase with HDIG domain